MEHDDPTTQPGAAPPSPLIVGIGASAASLASVERFFSRYVPMPELAVMLVFQHREALDEEQLRRSMETLEQSRIATISDGMLIEGGQVYLCSSDRITTVHDGRFATRPAEEGPGDRGTVDSCLVSLAEHRGEEAIGVVLAGIGGDGTLGVAALKEQGGLAIAERAKQGDQLTNGNTAAAIADFLLLPEDMPEHIAVYARHLLRRGERREIEDALSAASGSLTRVADILRNKTGNDFHGYKRNTFLRRVQRRMQVKRVDTIDAYLELLRADKDEVQHLFNDLLIGVTQFFRDDKEFEILASDVVPKMFEGRGAGQSVRVWVLGCATGEEAYSIGILLREHMAAMDSPPTVQIFATDIDGRALAAARVGRYRSSIADDVSPERLARWFVKEGDTYCIVKELREMCIFSQHNVIKDAPFSKLDLISCRNLLIYLNADLQSRFSPLFHFALLPDRYLFLGNSENVTRHPKLFVPVDRRARIFRRLESSVRLPPEFPLSAVVSRRAIDPVTSRSRAPEVGMERRAQRIAERYAPAYVIVDEQLQVLHFSGRMGRFIEPTAGAATLDLLNLVHRDLRLELRATLNRAIETNEAAHAE